MKVQKIKDWIKNRQAQFEVVSFDGFDINIVFRVRRLIDGREFKMGVNIFEDNSYITIGSFDIDLIHVSIKEMNWDKYEADSRKQLDEFISKKLNMSEINDKLNNIQVEELRNKIIEINDL